MFLTTDQWPEIKLVVKAGGQPTVPTQRDSHAYIFYMV